MTELSTVTRANVTRQQFKDAIEAGIEAARKSYDFTHKDAKRLREIGQTAIRALSGDYELTADLSPDRAPCECPASLVLSGDYGRSDWDTSFAWAYDKALGFSWTTLLRVTDA